ncbi:phage N-6-adenine-methyltransferase [Massilia agilis]|uniref:Phage N-6-adenine-methyltransferase n=1 Tax=Massilia agilis TaxID=1811226 RepID=A0ABT2DBY0_9BURK|nr:phage N-6-adenine-methyltransferase [Massilia agilis]MCS0808667.1 phage N-6-adenine-methyltransferase [Massilia agilis]
MSASHRFDNAKRRRPDDHARQAMLTPAYVLEPVRSLLGGFDLDPCTEPGNPTDARAFYCLPQDGCSLPWDGDTVWCNPPYGEARDRWVTRCIAEARMGKRVALLIPAHPDTRTFQKALLAADSILFFKGRLKFGVLRENGRQEAASHGSALFGFNVDLTPLSSLGVVVVPRQVQQCLRVAA